MRQRRWRQWRGYSGAAAGEQQQGKDSVTAGDSNREGGSSREVRVLQNIEHFSPIFGQIIHSYILPTFGPSIGYTPAKHTASMGHSKALCKAHCIEKHHTACLKRRV